MAKYIVQQGECISSIAYEYGFFPDTLWNLSENADLKQKRNDPNVLFPGDEVFIPDKREKTESGATEQKHRFKRKGVPERIRIVLKDKNGRPRANLPYTIEIDGEIFQDQTDHDGRIDHPIPPNAKQGKLIIGIGNEQEVYNLLLGYIDPVTEVSGVQARLKNLGFDYVIIDGKLGPRTKEAIRNFQAKHGLTVTGEPNQATQQKLKEEHGS